MHHANSYRHGGDTDHMSRDNPGYHFRCCRGTNVFGAPEVYLSLSSV